MARSVFYSFHYQNDISRVMTVRNRWVTYGGQKVSGVIDHADFEKVQRQGDTAIKNWINNQMIGTTATIVLIGEETLRRPYVQYEIQQSLNRGNAILGVYINRIKDFYGRTSLRYSSHIIIGYDSSFIPLYFDEIVVEMHDYVLGDGYNNLDTWVENAVRKHQ